MNKPTIFNRMPTITALLLLAINILFVNAIAHESAHEKTHEKNTHAVTTPAQTQVFAIEKMTCKMCPITIRKAMEQVEGVSKATVDFEQKTASVVYDPSKTNPEEIALASTNIGYPAKVK